ncbi:sigma-54 dependent transcriptional regulator [Dasania sp. GY-MA-18]|uniref:Sigma-54 dependent transcriptional regulator n=2 Tax=Spongiibacteraceae TaxID=1706375 RepID=A0A9J6RHP8_9GAMM|nr:sigma-54 dependent transcriptional regulator [Dasania sp. GY-MA-18]MCZ0863792.1 sigma-54 dependent transcriptional regulator [Dasania phycosphaerae]MCZ0867520.1 sigma-54 dependent transcriptional regulator [Dasania phycosphaerae]
MLSASILVVEDDRDLREALADTLEIAGCKVTQADSAEQALTILPRQVFDMVVSDINMGAMDGMALLKAVRQDYPQLPMLLITAYGSVSASVEAIRNGAVDYLVKPFKPQLLVDTVSRYVGVASPSDDEGPVAVEASSLQLLQLAKRVAATDSTVLICGESGTGKEVLARYIHQQSSRAQQPFIAINCAAIPENMLEGMLFGHEKGAFTGAYSSMPGKFEQANGGTLLLDEISEMDISLQAKLLRVIQEREVERLGGRKTISLDVRILATTNRHLAEEVSNGRFREDLYYRLSVFPLNWLPLRERRQDILAIAQRLLNNHTLKMGRVNASFDQQAQQALINHPWPGNVRELDNVVQRALIMQPGNIITSADLRIDPFAPAGLAASTVSAVAATSEQPAADDSNALGSDLQRREFEIILNTLRSENGSRKNTAEKLGISPRTLRYKIARMRDSGFDVAGGDSGKLQAASYK